MPAIIQNLLLSLSFHLHFFKLADSKVLQHQVCPYYQLQFINTWDDREGGLNLIWQELHCLTVALAWSLLMEKATVISPHAEPVCPSDLMTLALCQSWLQSVSCSWFLTTLHRRAAHQRGLQTLSLPVQKFKLLPYNVPWTRYWRLSVKCCT